MKAKKWCQDEYEDLVIGDRISYKRNGRRGTYYGIVTGIGLHKVGVKLTSHDGCEIEPQHINVNPWSIRIMNK